MHSLAPFHSLSPPKLSLISLSDRLSPCPCLLPTLPSAARSLRLRPFLTIRAIDAAQPFDYEAKAAREFHNSQKLKIAIIGFGNFGQFLSKTLVRQGHTVLAHSRSDYSDIARNYGVSFFPDADDLAEQHPEVILLCTSIISAKEVLQSLPLQRFRRNTLFVDVLSVKEFPKELMLEILPDDFDIVCSHPMFGPESGSDGWEGLYFVYEKVRIGSEESRVSRVEKFLNIFEKEGCDMVEMSCAEHDKHAAGSQFITHTIGRVLETLRLESTPINTKGYEGLLDLVKNTSGDSFDLYYGLFIYNNNALQTLGGLSTAFEELKKQLFGQLHGVVRQELLEVSDNVPVLPENYEVSKHPENGAGLILATPSEATRYHDYVHDYRVHISKLKLKIAMVGFGNYGQFLAKTILRRGHTVLAYSRSDYSAVAQELGVSYFSDPHDLCEEHPDVILLCTSILSTEGVLKSLPLQRLKRSTLFVDVLSVKEFPRNLFLQTLPPDFDILCLHPMFGPASGKSSWASLPLVYDRVRVGYEVSRVARCDSFLDIFSREGCRMVEMSCAEHDRYAAGSQFITHTMGRILEKLGLESTPVNTKGYQTLLNLVQNTSGDSFDLYYGLFLYNVNALEELQKFDLAVSALKKQLFGRLHGVLRKQLFENSEVSDPFTGKTEYDESEWHDSLVRFKDSKCGKELISNAPPSYFLANGRIQKL